MDSPRDNVMVISMINGIFNDQRMTSDDQLSFLSIKAISQMTSDDQRIVFDNRWKCLRMINELFLLIARMLSVINEINFDNPKRLSIIDEIDYN
jgi:hypothetical protein